MFERADNNANTNTDRAVIYIEGDGLAWLNRKTPSLDPTPINPVALRMAASDPAPHVIYMARPCQYSKMSAPNTPCPQKYWTSHRFAPEIIQSMNNALDDIKNRYNLKGFDLVGFSGGGGIAVLLAARRDDVLSLRSVTGNLDHKLFTQMHNISPLTGSLNPADAAKNIAHIPQHHFIGAKDTVITPAIVESFMRTAENTHCIRSSIIPNTEHEKGWINQWPTLLKYNLECSAEGGRDGYNY